MSSPEIKNIQLELITPYSGNAKKHPSKQVEEIAKSISLYGFNVPILLDKSHTIIAGHGRYLAAVKLGLDHVPTVMLDSLSPEQVRKFRMADNKVGESNWDEKLLFEELLDLKINDFGLLDIPGFSEADINSLLNGLEDSAGLTDQDDVPDVKEECSVLPGDLYQLGGHMLMCGDSTKPSDVSVLLNGHQCSMCFTDPPYNVNYSGGNKQNREKIKNDSMAPDAFYSFMNSVYQNIASSLVDGGAFYICHADSMWKPFREPLAANGLIFRQCLMWVKGQFVFSRGDYHYRHEPILYGNKKGRHFWNGGRNKDSVMYQQIPSIVVEDHGDKKTVNINTNDGSVILSVSDYKLEYQDEGMETVWYFPKPNRSEEHPTMKPVELVKRAVRNSSAVGDVVFDCFLGSGSTLIACEALDRRCYGMELTPEYCDVIIRRWENYTGKKANLIKRL